MTAKATRKGEKQRPGRRGVGSQPGQEHTSVEEASDSCLVFLVSEYGKG